MPTLTPGQWSNRAATALAPVIFTSGGQTVNQLKAAMGTQANVFNDWSGAAYRYDTDQLVSLVPGGDQDGASNESYLTDIGADTSVRIFDPTLNIIPSNGSHPAGDHISYYTDLAAQYGPINGEFPASRHPYNGLQHQPGTNLVFCFGGAPWNISGGSVDVFSFDTVTKIWTRYPLDPLLDSAPGNVVAWDPRGARFLIRDAGTGSLSAWKPSNAPGSRFSRLVLGSGNTVSRFWTAFVDARRNRFVIAGPRNLVDFFPTILYYDLAAVVDPPTILTPWPNSLAGAAAPGFDGDTTRDRYVYYAGGSAIQFVDPVSGAVTQETGTGDTPPAIATNGTFGRFRYSPNLDTCISLQDFTTGVSLYKFRTAPVLAFTDLLSGPKTGNADTAFGQVANQDGAYVTIFTLTPVTAQDTIAVTINGAPARVIDFGQAHPPRIPANLYNTWQKLHCIVAQVSHLATDGVGVIHVTVNGLAEISPNLAFTVTPGHIYYAATSGGDFTDIQTGMNALVGGDVLYVRNGVNATNGLSAGPNTVAPSGQLALAAYPGATVQLGDGTHDACITGSSGGSGNMTFAKCSIRGSDGSGIQLGQAMTVRDNGRLVGLEVEVPAGNGSRGAVGMHGSNIKILGCELTNCGASRLDDQYHTVYRYGSRGGAGALESGFEGAHCYFHGNNAARAFNNFNNSAPMPCSPIGDADIHHNVIVDQAWAGIGFQAGCVGTNKARENLLIRCGLYDPSGNPSAAQGVAVQILAAYPDGITPTAPIVIELTGNTALNSGDLNSTDRGALELRNVANYTLKMRNNIFAQENGIAYLSPNSEALGADATNRSNNAWHGAGAAPALDSASITADPLLINNAGSTPDLHLQPGSPCLGVGAALGAIESDFAGVTRPATKWDVGAYQFGGVASPPAPPGPVINSLNPSTGPAGVQITILGSNFSGTPGGNIVLVGSTPATIVSEGVLAIQCLIPLLPDGAYNVTVTTSAGVSNGLPFNELTGFGTGHGVPFVRTRYRVWA